MSFYLGKVNIVEVINLNKFKKHILFLLILLSVLSFEFNVYDFSILNSNYKVTNVKASQQSVILGGNSIGITMELDGVLVLGFSEFLGFDGKKHCPARESGLQEQDLITSVNDNQVKNANDFFNLINNIGTEQINLTYERNGQEYSIYLNSVKSAEDGMYHIGLWAKNGTNGIGTLTFINPQNNTFASLGHGITDNSSGELITKEMGSIYYASIKGITKGTDGNTGELHGTFVSNEIGNITKNNQYGIYGNFYETKSGAKIIEIASREEIQIGKAQIYCCIKGEDVKPYDIEIEAINNSAFTNKCMVIKITDNELISKTGGIIQGMSGSPIVQNNKLIGAITHVMINNPKRGYAIFADIMASYCEK